MVTRWGRRLLVGIAAATVLVMGVPGGLAFAGPVVEPDPDTVSSADVDVAAPVDDGDSDEAADDAPEAAAAPAPTSDPAVGADQRAARAWEGHGRPARMIIVRSETVDTVEAGRLTRQVPRVPGALTIDQLAASAPPGWIATTPAATRVAAAVVLGPTVVLNLHGAAPTVQLVGGPALADAASIYTGSGQLAAHGITVTSADPVTGQPMPPGLGRPFVSVGTGGRLLSTDTTFSDLGSLPAGSAEGARGRPGVGFAAGSNGTLARTTLLRNTIGLRLNGSSGVRLENVLVAESVADGLVLRGDKGTRLVDVRAERNAGNGVLVTGPSTDRPVTGISTTGNGAFGIALAGQTAPRVVGVSTRADRTGGLQVSGGTDAAISGLTAVDQPIGVLSHSGAVRVGLGDLSISGGERGVVVEKTTAGLELTGSRIDGADVGVAIGGSGVRVSGVQIDGSRSGLRIERGAGDITTTALTLSGGQEGVVVLAGTRGVVLRDLVANGVANYAVRTAGPQTEIVGGRISGGATGIAADAATSIRGVDISQVDVGIRARSKEPVAAQSVTVSAETSGVAADSGSRVVLTNSQVSAAEAVHGAVELVGHNDLSLPPLNTIGIIGIPLIALALVLDQLQRFRARRRAPRTPVSATPHPVYIHP